MERVLHPDNPIQPGTTPTLDYSIKTTPEEGLLEKRKKEIKDAITKQMKKSFVPSSKKKDEQTKQMVDKIKKDLKEKKRVFKEELEQK